MGPQREGDDRQRRARPGYHDPTHGIGGAPPARSALTLRLVLAAVGVTGAIRRPGERPAIVRGRHGRVAQLVRAFASHAKGQGFESLHVHPDAAWTAETLTGPFRFSRP